MLPIWRMNRVPSALAVAIETWEILVMIVIPFVAMVSFIVRLSGILMSG